MKAIIYGWSRRQLFRPYWDVAAYQPLGTLKDEHHECISTYNAICQNAQTNVANNNGDTSISNVTYPSPIADTSSQYDAIRAYLKELDIIDNVWIGLSKKTEKSDFTWSDSRILSGEGHWREPIPIDSEPLCVTMDPTADFLWKPYPCGGPESASFICELQVPSWALGQKGCLLTELPSLTVLYIPEQMALELTSDCGLDGTKRITCKGNADHEEIMKQLTCAISNEDFDDKVGTTKLLSSPSLMTVTSDVTDFSYTEDTSADSRTPKPWASTLNTVYSDEMSTRHRRETEYTDATAFYRRSDVTEPFQASHASTSSDDNAEVTTANIKENLTVAASNDSMLTKIDSQAVKPSDFIPIVVTTPQYINTQQDESVANASAAAEQNSTDHSEDVAEYPSVINQGQLFSIIQNGTMFDIIELNDTAIEDTKPTKISVTPSTGDNNSSRNPEIISTEPTSTTIHSENKNSYTTVVYYKEPPPDSTQVTNKSPKKFDRQSKTKYYKKSDPKKINYQSEKDQRKKKDEKYKPENGKQVEIDEDLNKEVDMFPVIASGGPLVKLNRTHRKELPVIDENEKDFFDLNNENPDFTSDVEEDNKLRSVEQHKHIEIKLGKKDDSNASDIFIVTTKFIEEQHGKKTASHNESTTTFSGNHNETVYNKGLTTRNISQLMEKLIPTPTNLDNSAEVRKKPLLVKSTSTDILIDPRLDDFNRNVSQNNESELLITLAEVEKVENNENAPWDKDEIMSKSLLGEIETITDDVIENNTSELENPTSEPLNSEPITPGRPNRRRKLTNSQRRSFYPYFFSRVLG